MQNSFEGYYTTIMEGFKPTPESKSGTIVTYTIIIWTFEVPFFFFSRSTG